MDQITKYNIIYASFMNFVLTTNGGALNLISDENISLSHCLFIKCQSKKIGGALYNVSPSLLLESTCFIECSAQFSDALYTERDLSTSLSKLIQNSVISSHSLTDLDSNIEMQNGISYVKELNFSRNYLYRIPCFYYNKVEYIEHFFINMENNHGKGSAYNTISQYCGKTYLEYHNVISNSCDGLDYLIYSDQPTSFIVKFSNFIDNSAVYIFQAEVEVDSCYLFNNPPLGASLTNELSSAISIKLKYIKCNEIYKYKYKQNTKNAKIPIQIQNRHYIMF